MEMPVSPGVCPKVSMKSNIWAVKSGYRIYTAKVVRREEGRNNRGRGMHRSYSYVGEYAAAPKCSTIYGVPQGKKYPDDI